jgi:hypothetical protein
MKRLALRLPTVWHTNPGLIYLFYEGGVCRFTYPTDQSPYLSLDSANFDRIWALVDSNGSLVQPAAMFCPIPTFFVVEAAPPHAPHIQWFKKVAAETFHMKRWSFSEVLQAYVNSPRVYP